MAGLFGLGSKNEEYFLDSDDAKTLGDIDYMRKSKTVKRTFPKIQGGKGAKIVQEVSSLGKKVSKNDQFNASTSNFKSVGSSAAGNKEVEIKKTFTPPRSVDSSMDMFRNMAKKMKR